MATVYRERGFRVIIWSNDHGPAHVHVFKAGAEAIIIIPRGIEAPDIRDVRGMREADVAEAMQLVRDNAELLQQKWKEIHG